MAAVRPRITVVITFVGTAPFYLPAFLVSCRANPDVRWIIYTDVEMGSDLPPNVVVKTTTVAELEVRFSRVVGQPVTVKARKLNDLKILSGVAFADDLRDADFWAYADLDVVWGDLRRFLTDDLLAGIDVFSSRPDKLSGHFTLFRNTPAINRAYELIPDVQARLADPQYHHLDERELTVALRQAMDRGWPGPPVRVYWQEELSTNAAFQRALGDTPADALWWRDGRTFAPDGRELMYVHFHKLKQHMTTVTFGPSDSPRAFSISRRGFVA